MATDFWASSHYKRWIVDRATLRQARSDDLEYVDSEEQLDFLNIYFGNLIAKLAKRLGLRQRAIATATVFFRRFYIKNSFCETDPFIVISACCYVAAKAEESPVHIKNVVTESRSLFGKEEYGIKHFPSDNSKIAEMEFYLVNDLECDLTVFHPYRTLMTLCGPDAVTAVDAEAGELGIGIDDGPRYWGTGEGKLVLEAGPLQMAWFVINDTYRSDICLLYPPHLIAIAAVYVALVLNAQTRTLLQTQSQAHAQPPAPNPTRRSSRQHSGSGASTNTPPKKAQDVVDFMAGLNVSLELVATIAQEIISLYTLWARYDEDGVPEAVPHNRGRTATDNLNDIVVTPHALSRLLFNMRAARMEDLAHPASGRPVAVNKMLERTQAAG
ncbi:cyclin-like protein [Amylostereum chailletii]|nr:cyclin-like protein [Amylostereum chailletii]